MFEMSGAVGDGEKERCCWRRWEKSGAASDDGKRAVLLETMGKERCLVTEEKERCLVTEEKERCCW